jgi:tRNA-Thr(GGU) m(6)t(6)A37 methyltransferase TsaA
MALAYGQAGCLKTDNHFVIGSMTDFDLQPVGRVRSALKSRSEAPRQAAEGAPMAEVIIAPEFAGALDGIGPGENIWIFTWLHEANRATLKVHPRGNRRNPLTGVFATRSPDRPNPIGLHRAKVLEVDGLTLRVDALEAIDGTPVLDIKPALICEPA